MSYPHAMAESLDWHVRRNYFRKLSSPACHLYGAFRWIERDLETDKKHLFCKPVFVNYRDMANAARIDIGSVRKALDELAQQGLIVRNIGNPDKSKKEATMVQRMTQDELKAHSMVGDDHPQQLAQALNRFGSYIFNEQNVITTWNPKRTGRVYASAPFNFQRLKGGHDARWAGLKSGLQPGQALAYADIKTAEPTVLKHYLGMPQGGDLYSEYAAIEGVSRDDAKEKFKPLAYGGNSMKIMSHWPELAKDAFQDYAFKLDAFKKPFLAGAKREAGITTMSGRFIPTDKKERIHAGKPLSWLAQGSIADIINPACLNLMKQPGVELVLPVHDAIYVILPAESVGIVSESIMEEARKIGLPITLKTDEYHAP